MDAYTLVIVALVAFVLYKLFNKPSPPVPITSGAPPPFRAYVRAESEGNDGFPNQAWQRFINATLPVLQRQHLSTADAIPGMGASLFLCSCLFNVRTPLVLI
jgi:hypothetical protein